MPILIRSLENANGDPYATPIIEEALRLLSGIDLPEGSTPQEWRRQWAEHKETHRSSDSWHLVQRTQTARLFGPLNCGTVR